MRIGNGFDDFFCLRSNVSNDDIISTWRLSLKSGMGFSGLVWKRERKSTFFGLKSGQDLENRAAHPYQDIPRSTPPPPASFSEGQDRIAKPAQNDDIFLNFFRLNPIKRYHVTQFWVSADVKF